MEAFYLKYKQNTTPIESFSFNEISSHGITLHLKRLDLVHPFISGNKYYKLKYNLIKAQQIKAKAILSFGGAYSNHILATARAGFLIKIPTIGLIRGEELAYDLSKTLSENPILKQADSLGMKLSFVTRAEYREKENKEFLLGLQANYPHSYILPQGGTNELAVKGTGEILDQNTLAYNYICVPLGTGGTFYGLLKSAASHQMVLGFSSLKHCEMFYPSIELYAPGKKNYKLIEGYHFGGFAKKSNELDEFIERFREKNALELDFTYNGKMLYGIVDMVKKGFFRKQDKILAIYTLSQNFRT